MSSTEKTVGQTAGARRSHDVHEDSRIEGTVGVSEVEASVIALGGLSRVDYVDHFVLSPVPGKGATPEQWARTMFGDVPDVAERFIWQVLLRLRLHAGPSPSTVAGWQIAQRGDDWIRLEAASRVLRANLVVRATERSLSLTTFMQYDRFDGRMVWTLVSTAHRRLSPGLLRDAVAKVSSSQS